MVSHLPPPRLARSLWRQTAAQSALFLGLLAAPTMSTTPSEAAPATRTAPVQRATLGGGCFWCLEAVFERFDGVRSVVSGYAGGKQPKPTYKEVCSGTTGHAEVVQIEFDPALISYAQLLAVFWECHDPTTLNRQGGDEGSQYRSIILYHDASQKAAAEESLKAAATGLKQPIVTELMPLDVFFPAESNHQDYYRRNPDVPYCAVVISPKLKKLEKLRQSAAAGRPR